MPKTILMRKTEKDETNKISVVKINNTVTEKEFIKLRVTIISNFINN